jgi:hypothetical protein
MKKLIVLSVLLGLLALPMFAEHASIDFGGDDSYGFIGDFGDNEAELLDLTWDVIVGIDDYNSFTWSLKGLQTAGGILLDKALTTTDIGKWLGLPVGFKVMWGYDDPDANEFAVVSGYATEEIYNFSPLEYWGVDFMLSWNFLEVEVAFNPGVASVVTDLGYLLAGLAVKEPIPGLNAEVYYFQGGDVAVDVFDAGNIAFGAGYATAFGDVELEAGAAFHYELDDTAAIAWYWGLGLAAGYGMFDVTVGLGGEEGAEFDDLSATLEVAPIDQATVYAGMKLEFDTLNDEAFRGADVGVNLHVGAVEVYLGYLITSNGEGDYNAPATLTDGGAYLKFDVDY